MKKFLTLLLSLALVAMATVGLVGCGGEPEDPYATDVSVKIAPIAKEDLKIGVLHINPLESTSGYTYAHQQGIEEMIENIGLDESQMVYKASLADNDDAAISSAIDDLIAQGCNLIIGTSFGYGEVMRQKAHEYTNVLFSHGTGFYSYRYNLNNYFGRIYQARYLSGIVAGMKASEGANIGYVSAFGTDNAECASGINAFALGVQTVNPTAKVYVRTLQSWFDLTNERAFADALLAAPYNCEIVAQHCDTSGPSQAAQAVGKYSVGYNSDMATAITSDGSRDSSVLTSVLWHWGVYYTQLVEATIAGEWDAEGGFGNYYGDFADGLFDIAVLSPECPDGTQEIVNLVREIMREGTEDWDVFTGVKLSFEQDEDGVWSVVYTDAELKDNAGNVIVAAGGASVEDSVIKSTMNYFVEGVELAE